MKTIMLAVALLAVAYGQEKTDGDKLVTVPSKYVSTEGLTHQANSLPAQASQWVGVGKEIGEATREGLSAVVDVSGKFSQTNVGRFVMLMVAWKVMGKEVIGVMLGVPVWLLAVSLWIWSMRRFFFGRRVLASDDKASKTKTYQTEPAFKFGSNDSRAVAGVFHAAFAVMLFLAPLFLFL